MSGSGGANKCHPARKWTRVSGSKLVGSFVDAIGTVIRLKVFENPFVEINLANAAKIDGVLRLLVASRCISFVVKQMNKHT